MDKSMEHRENRPNPNVTPNSPEKPRSELRETLNHLRRGVYKAVAWAAFVGALYCGFKTWEYFDIEEKKKNLPVEFLDQASELPEIFLRLVEKSIQEMQSLMSEKYDHGYQEFPGAGIRNQTYDSQCKLTPVFFDDNPYKIEYTPTQNSSFKFHNFLGNDLDYDDTNDLYSVSLYPSSVIGITIGRINFHTVHLKPKRDDSGNIVNLSLSVAYYDSEHSCVLDLKPDDIKDPTILESINKLEKVRKEFLTFRSGISNVSSSDTSKPARLAKNPEFQNKLKSSMVQIHFISSDGVKHFCSGVAFDDRTIVTSKHCLKDDTGNDQLMKGIRFVKANGDSSDFITQPAYKIASSSEYDIIESDEFDIAIVRFKTPVLKGRTPLDFRSNPVINRNEIYLFGHQVAYDEDRSWKMDFGSVNRDRNMNMARNDSPYKLNAFNQPGNSGTPVVDDAGRVVGIMSKSGGYFAPISKEDVLGMIKRIPN